MALLEDQLRPLVEAESSLLVDILYHPHLLFAVDSENRAKANNGGFIKKYVNLFEQFPWLNLDEHYPSHKLIIHALS